MDLGRSALGHDGYGALGSACVSAQNGGSAAARAGTGGFADAAFPYPDLDILVVQYLHENDICAVRKGFVNLELFAVSPPVE